MEKIVRGGKIAVLLIVVLFLFFWAFDGVFASPATKGFEVDNVLLKLIIKQGEPISKTIKITNTDSVRKEFIVAENLDFLSVSEREFSLEPSEAKTLEIGFETEEKPGVYVGNILIYSGKEEYKIPIILEIETKEALFDSSINILLEYGEIYPGGKLAVENKVFNLENIGLKTVNVNYAAKDFDGRTIFSEEENIAVENQVLTTKLISIPESAKIGDYVLFVEIEYLGSVGTSSHFFKIVEKQEQILGSFKFFDSWIFIVILFAVIMFFIFFTKQRDRLFLELEKQHRKELRKEIEKLEKEKEKIRKLKPEKRKRKLREFEKKKRKRLRAVKIIYKTRVKVLEKLKKEKRKNEMQRKLAQWKRQGININEFLIKTGKKKEKLGDRIKKMKKEGYKV